MVWPKGRPRSEEEREKIRKTMCSIEHRANISKRFSDLWQDPEYRQHQIQVRLGKHHSEEHNRKIAESGMGRRHTPEAKEKNRRATLQQWAEGKAHPRVCETGCCCGRHSLEKRTKLREARLGSTMESYIRERIAASMVGRPFSQAHKENIRKAANDPITKEKKRQFHLGRKRSPETRALLKIAVIKATKASQEANPSRLELEVRAVLDLLGVTYIPQKEIPPYVVDIFIPAQNLIIECDGSYWHSLPGAKGFDARRDAWLKRRGFLIQRLSEEVIRQDTIAAVQGAINHV